MSQEPGFTTSEFIKKYFSTMDSDLNRIEHSYDGNSYELSVDNRKFYFLINSLARELVSEILESSSGIYSRINKLEKIIEGDGGITLNATKLEGNIGLAECPKLLINNESNVQNGNIFDVKINSKLIPFLFKQGENILIQNKFKLILDHPEEAGKTVQLDKYLKDIKTLISMNEKELDEILIKFNNINTNIDNKFNKYYDKNATDLKISELIENHSKKGHLNSESEALVAMLPDIKNSIINHMGDESFSKYHLSENETKTMRDTIQKIGSGYYATSKELQTLQNINSDILANYNALFDVKADGSKKIKSIYLPASATGGIDIGGLEDRLFNLEVHAMNNNIHLDNTYRSLIEGKYTKPSTGIPYADLDANVKSLLNNIGGGEITVEIKAATEEDINNLFN